MNRFASLALTGALLATLSTTTHASVNPEDLAWKTDWTSRHLAKATDGVPFRFVYGGQSSDALLPQWDRKDETKQLDVNRTQRTSAWTDPKSGLEVRCVSVEYADFPVVEWTVYFRNTGKADTPIIENIQAIDTSFSRGESGEFVLHHAIGSPCLPHDFQPLETPLGRKAHKRISAAGGRPTSSDMCYFNLEWPGQGVIVAFGWPGQWAAGFVRDDKNSVQVVGGQELTHFKLLPGEEARSPLVALLFWKGGDWIRAQNVWRRWMVADNLPRPGGKPVPTHFGSCWSATLHPSAEEELAIVNGFHREGVKLDYYFIDAGWYPSKTWTEVGTWELDKTRFPNGMREVSDRVHALGTKFVLWFEPERVTPGTWIYENHPDWMLSRSPKQETKLLNLGNSEARQWVTEHFNRFINEQGIDVYREDFNMDPLAYWQATDAPDRQGLTEIKHIEGHLALWDELLRRNPNIYIDTCASGGRRHDLETLRRSVPLLRSDFFSTPETQQAQTMGISLWVPYFGSGNAPSDIYWCRSCFFPASRVGMDTRNKDLDYTVLKKMMDEFHQVEKYLLGDFYPLTSYSRAMDADAWAASSVLVWPPRAPTRSLPTDVWAAWQYDRPEMGEGMVQAFRRDDSPYETARFKLRGLDPKATYRLKDLDKTESFEVTGKDLMESGLPISLPQRRSACIVQYQRVK